MFRRAGLFLGLSVAWLGLGADDLVASGLQPVLVEARRQTPPNGTGLGQSAFDIEAAFILRSSHPDFGGLSGMWLDEAGERLVAVGDNGWVWRASLRHDAEGGLIDIDGWSGARIADAPSSDGEALAGDDIHQGVLVAYEGRHAFQRLSLPDLEPSPGGLPVPGGLGGPSNSGMEALADLGDGRFLAMAEGGGAPGGRGLSAWILERSGPRSLIYQVATGFAPTGADRLDNDIYVVERQFSLLGGFRSQISRLSMDQLSGDAPMVPHILATFRYGDIGENFEAIETRKAPDGRTLFYLLADDNFSFLQQTVLLQLSLEEAYSDLERPLPAPK